MESASQFSSLATLTPMSRRQCYYRFVCTRVRNAAPLGVLSAICVLVLSERHTPASRPFLALCGLIVLVGDSLVWLLARPHTVHAGASGLVFGLVGMQLAIGLLAMGWPPRCSVRVAKPMAATVLVMFLYGGVLWGLAPTSWLRAGVSFEMHVAGFTAGMLAAHVVQRRDEGRWLPPWLTDAVFGGGRPGGGVPSFGSSPTPRYGTIP